MQQVIEIQLSVMVNQSEIPLWLKWQVVLLLPLMLVQLKQPLKLKVVCYFAQNLID